MPNSQFINLIWTCLFYDYQPSTENGDARRRTHCAQRSCSEEQRKREERNRKQREYCARIRAQETSDEREERNKRQREYRARRKAESTALSNAPDQPAVQYPETSTVGGAHPSYETTSSGVLQPMAEGCFSTANINFFHINMTATSVQAVQQSPFQTGYSGIFTGPSSVQDKENQDPCDSPKWLHRNDNYVRSRHQVCGDSALEQSAKIAQDPSDCLPFSDIFMITTE